MRPHRRWSCDSCGCRVSRGTPAGTRASVWTIRGLQRNGRSAGGSDGACASVPLQHAKGWRRRRTWRKPGPEFAARMRAVPRAPVGAAGKKRGPSGGPILWSTINSISTAVAATRPPFFQPADKHTKNVPAAAPRRAARGNGGTAWRSRSLRARRS